MQLDKLVLDLRPRSNMAALDLGFALLRVAPKSVWQAWLMLWLPLMALVTLFACLWPEWATLGLVLPWWLRPLLERAPLYVLSRSVFGETVSWQQTLKAFPGQLRGGLWHLLVLRVAMAGRCLRQPIWQLEGARGKTASNRFAVISRQGAANSAFWFGIACAHFELVLQIGSMALISLFLPSDELINPFQIFITLGKNEESLTTILLSYGVFALAGGLIGPIYTACGLTLYLNRRATLEAWDIEISLRQIQPPVQAKRPAGPLATLLLLFGLLGLFGPGQPEAHAVANCTAPPTGPEAAQASAQTAAPTSAPAPQHPEQQKMQQQLDTLYQSEALKDWSCEKRWKLRKDIDLTPNKVDDRPASHSSWLDWLEPLAGLIKLLLIGTAIGLVAWFFWHFRSHWLALLPQLASAPPLPQVAGLDIRPESLPDDVVQAVRQLWQENQQRAALALLYRATLSHLVSQHRLPIAAGATEADCLALAQSAHLGPAKPPVLPLPEARWQVMDDCTRLWLAAAWGNRWPDSTQIEQLCQQWQQAFASHSTSRTTSSTTSRTTSHPMSRPTGTGGAA